MSTKKSKTNMEDGLSDSEFSPPSSSIAEGLADKSYEIMPDVSKMFIFVGLNVKNKL